MTNMPPIRFSDFADVWKPKDFSEVVEVHSGRDYKHLSDGNIPVYGTGGYMLSVNEALSYEEDAVGIGRKGTIDKPQLLKAPFWTVDTLFYAVPKSGYDLDFVFDLFQNVDWKKKDESTGVPSLSKTAINTVSVRVPQFSEQHKIGLFFSELDSMISTEQRKYEKLVALKSACLNKMFPQNNTAVPELRLNGFTDAWKRQKLEDFVTFFSGLTYSPKDVSNSGVLVLRSSNIKNDEVVDADNVYVAPDVVNSEYVKKGDIVIVVRNGSRSLIGKHARVKKDMPNTVIGAFMTGIRCEHSSFVNALLNTTCFDAQVTANMGATINQITGYMFSNMSFYIPSEEEQDAIGDYFDKLESLICYTQKRLDKLKQFKQAMLNSMLV